MSTARAGSSASGICRSRIRTSVGQSASAVEDARQRVQRLGVGRAADRSSCSQVWRARAQIVQLAFHQPGQLAQVLGLLRRIGDDALDLQVQDARQVLVAGPAPCRSRSASPSALRVVGIEADDLFQALRPRRPDPAAGRAGCRRCGAGSAASRRGWRRAWCADRARCTSSAGSPARSRIRSSRVSVSRSPGTACRISFAAHWPCGQIAGPLVADHQHPAQQADALLLRARRDRSARAAACARLTKSPSRS